MDNILETARLLLRPPEDGDVAEFAPLIGRFAVAKNLSAVPHPYREADGFAWVTEMRAARAKGTDYVFALIRKYDGTFIGICAVHPWRDFELGYWLGEPYWGTGYATEAGHRVAHFAFEELGATQLLSAYMYDNPASGRVLSKLGFLYTHDEMRACVSRAQEVLQHRMALTRERFLSNVTP